LNPFQRIGINAEDAIPAVRAARKATVETTAQEACVRNCETFICLRNKSFKRQ